MGNSFERDDLQLHGLNCTGAFVASNAFTGNISVDGLGTTVTGVILVTCQTAQFCGNSVSGTFSSAGFDLSGIDALNCVFSGNQVNISSGTPWIMPANNQRINCSFIGNDNPSNAITFVGLPGQGGQHLAAVQGQTFYITDGNQATAGSSVTAGSGSNKSWVTYDGTNWIRGAA